MNAYAHDKIKGDGYPYFKCEQIQTLASQAMMVLVA